MSVRSFCVRTSRRVNSYVWLVQVHHITSHILHVSVSICYHDFGLLENNAFRLKTCCDWLLILSTNQKRENFFLLHSDLLTDSETTTSLCLNQNARISKEGLKAWYCWPTVQNCCINSILKAHFVFY